MDGISVCFLQEYFFVVFNVVLLLKVNGIMVGEYGYIFEFLDKVEIFLLCEEVIFVFFRKCFFIKEMWQYYGLKVFKKIFMLVWCGEKVKFNKVVKICFVFM